MSLSLFDLNSAMIAFARMISWFMFALKAIRKPLTKGTVAVAATTFLFPKKPPRIPMAFTFSSGHRWRKEPKAYGTDPIPRSPQWDDYSKIEGFPLAVGRNPGRRTKGNQCTTILHNRYTSSICWQVEPWTMLPI